MVDQVGVEGEKILSIGAYDMSFFKATPLTKEQKKQINLLYAEGYCDAQIAMKMRIEKSQVKYWRHCRRLTFNKGFDIRTIKKTEKESLPSYASPCKKLILNIQEIEEYLIKEYGKNLKPIIVPLSERAKVWNMNGVVIGSSYYTRRL